MGLNRLASSKLQAGCEWLKYSMAGVKEFYSDEPMPQEGPSSNEKVMSRGSD